MPLSALLTRESFVEEGTSLLISGNEEELSVLSARLASHVSGELPICAVDDSGHEYSIALEFTESVGDECYSILEDSLLLRFAPASADKAAARVEEVGKAPPKAFEYIDLHMWKSEDFSFIVLNY